MIAGVLTAGVTKAPLQLGFAIQALLARLRHKGLMATEERPQPVHRQQFKFFQSPRPGKKMPAARMGCGGQNVKS
ncbi:hypothetical protein MMA231_02898 [Asticcacaulis sp. MM231]